HTEAGCGLDLVEVFVAQAGRLTGCTGQLARLDGRLEAVEGVMPHRPQGAVDGPGLPRDGVLYVDSHEVVLLECCDGCGAHDAVDVEVVAGLEVAHGGVGVGADHAVEAGGAVRHGAAIAPRSPGSLTGQPEW